MTLDESARRLGGLVWTERRLFELLGGRVATTPEPVLKVALASASRRFGEHALALEALLPDTRDHEPEALVVPVGVDAARFDALASAEPGASRLDPVLDDLGASHLGALAAYLGDASPVRDGPGIRVVTTVLAEDRSLLEELRSASHR